MSVDVVKCEFSSVGQSTGRIDSTDTILSVVIDIQLIFNGRLKSAPLCL